MFLRRFCSASLVKELESTEQVKLITLAALFSAINKKLGDNDECSHKHIAYGVQAILDGKNPTNFSDYIDYQSSGTVELQGDGFDMVKSEIGSEAADQFFNEYEAIKNEMLAICWKHIFEIYNHSDSKSYREAFLRVAIRYTWGAPHAEWVHADWLQTN